MPVADVAAQPMDAIPAEVTVIIVSYNTRALTLAAIRTLLETTRETRLHVVVLDNDSHDGSADAVAEEFSEIELIRSSENFGFARANNIVAEKAETEWLLLLNPDTECHPGAVDNLMRFARETPQAGIWGGRTVFPDGSLNIASCWNRMTLWSVFCRTTGLSALLWRSEWFNSEAIGDWKRDTPRHVDVVVGCFFLIRRALWRELGGFNLKYFMYGEEADLCLRAARKGYRPMITPEAQIMHIVGAASSQSSRKKIFVSKARSTLMRDHWPAWQVPVGLGLMWGGAALRALVETLRRSESTTHRETWAARRDWLAGF
jgi:N-acetylglucosaminyl-diphospho-decaprenol L-rhamnosyltransferase